MNKKISLALALILILNIFVNVSFVSAAEETLPICVFNLAKANESFKQTSIFVTETKNSSDRNAAFGIKLSGTMDGSTQCNIRVYDANGNLAKSAVKNKKTTLSKENYEQIIYPIPAATKYNFFSKKQEPDYSSHDYNKISEDVFTVNIKKPETKDKSYKYYIIVDPIGCNATVTEINSDNCKVKTLDKKDYDLVNFTIASNYYNIITTQSMYMFPNIVSKYIETLGTDNIPFAGYDDMIEACIPSDKWIQNIYNGFSNIKMWLENYKDLLARGLVYNITSPITGKGFTDKDVTVIELQDMYEDILSKISPSYFEESLLEELNSTDTMKQYKEIAKVINTTTDIKSLYNSDVYTVRQYKDLIKQVDESNMVKDVMGKAGKGLKWWQAGEDFIASMLMFYDSKEKYIDAIDELFKNYNIPEHQEAISNIKSAYSKDFVQRFWYAANEAGMFDELGGEILKKTIGKEEWALKAKVIIYALTCGFKYSGFGDELDKVHKITMSAPIAKEIEKKMEEIQSKQLGGTATTEDLQNYACLFDIAKAIRVYQLEAMKKAYPDGDKTRISNLIDTVKSINITYDVTEKTGVEYKGRSLYTSIPDDGNHYLLITFNEYQTVEEYFSEYKNAPYTLYNGDGVDLKVHYSGAISSDNIVYSFNKPKLEINCGSKKEDAILTEYIEDGAEIDLSYYGIANGEKVTYICLVFDDVEEFSSIQEYNEKYKHSDSDWTSDWNKCIAYNYIENETHAGSDGGRF